MGRTGSGHPAYRSPDTGDPSGDTTPAEVLAESLDTLNEWTNWPQGNLFIRGIPGTGKTMMLMAILNEFGPGWALYITSYNFSRLITSFEEEDNNRIVSALAHVPILLYDDIGAEYVADGRNWIRSKLFDIIAARYPFPKEYPTVISSNYSIPELLKWNPLIASRITDANQSTFVDLVNVKSWRDGNGHS